MSGKSKKVAVAIENKTLKREVVARVCRAIISGRMTPIDVFRDIQDREECRAQLSSTTRSKMCGRQRVVEE